jgi:hypothetical protein
MPTDAHEGILAREFVAVSASHVTEKTSRLLREIVNHATMAFVRCEQEATSGLDVHLAPFCLYRHIIEVTDGIEVLLASCCATPSLPLLRSSYEALLSLEYILKEPATFERRSLSWIAMYSIRRLEAYEAMDRTTPPGLQMEEERIADELGHTVRPVDPVAVDNARHNMELLLNKPHLLPFMEAYRELNGRRGRRRRVFWSELHGGPSTLNKLAATMKQPLTHRLLHGHWSEAGHAVDFSKFLLHKPGERTAVRPLRDPSDAFEVAGVAATFLMAATQHMLAQYRPGEEDAYRRWYVGEVRDLFREITGIGADERS